MEEGAEKEVEEKEREILEKAEVSLIIDNYGDIFSDFDPRPFSHRALSVDFLDEAKRATREIEFGTFQLRFMLPKTERNSETEYMVRRRLREHFKKHNEMLQRDASKTKRKGMLLCFFGFLMMTFAAWIAFYGVHKFIYSVLRIIFEPGGWFTLWVGLDIIFFGTKDNRKEMHFYKKMTNAEIIFSYY
jgi:hypothetical protein